MGKTVVDITTSLDGFIAGPNDGPETPLGDGGERLHQWIYDLRSWREIHGLDGGTDNSDSEIMAEAAGNTGAVVMGKRMFNNGEPHWGDTPPFKVPVFVVTHEEHEPVVKNGGTTYTFVTDGIESALEQAKSVAGERDVSVAGGANVIQQLMNAGLLDQIQIHVVPLMMGDGVRLFDHLRTDHIELESTRVIGSTGVTHLAFRFVK